MPLLDKWEIGLLALVLILTTVVLLFWRPPQQDKGNIEVVQRCKDKMPKKNNKKKQGQKKQAEKKKAKAKAARAEQLPTANEVTSVGDIAPLPIADAATPSSNFRPEPDDVPVENERGDESESDDSDDDSDDDMEYMAKCMGIKVGKEPSKVKKFTTPRSLHSMLEQAQKEPEKTVQMPLPLGILHQIISFVKNDPNIQQVLTTRSLLDFSMAAADSWETAGLKSARTKLQQKTRKFLRKQEMEERGDDQSVCDAASVTNELTNGFDDHDYDYEDDGDFSDFYFSSKGAGKHKHAMGGKSNNFKAAKSRAHASMKRQAQRGY